MKYWSKAWKNGGQRRTGKSNQVAVVKDSANENTPSGLKVEFELPFPPSVNHYLGRRGHQTYKTAKAKAYNAEVALRVALAGLKAGFNTPLSVAYYYWMPDHRKRDIANYEKVLTDSMVTAGVMVDDHIIHRLLQEKMGVCKGGKVLITIEPYVCVTLSPA